MRTKIASMKYLLCFIAAVMMFGSSGIVASTLPLSAFEVCLMRLIIGALFMGLIFVVTRQQLPRHIGRRQYLFVALSGACLGLAMMTISLPTACLAWASAPFWPPRPRSSPWRCPLFCSKSTCGFPWWSGSPLWSAVCFC